MNAIRLLQIGAALALPASRAPAAPPLTDLVDERTALVLLAEDLPGLLENWERSPWARTWNDEQFAKFLAPVREKMKTAEWDDKVKAETGHTIRELLTLAGRQCLLAVRDFDDLVARTDGANPDVPIIFALDLGAGRELADLFQKQAEKGAAPDSTEEFQGETLHFCEPVDDKLVGWAIVGDVLLAGNRRDLLQQTVANLKRGKAASPLSESMRFQQLRRATPRAHFTLYLNLEALYPGLLRSVRAKAGAEEAPANPLGVTPEGMLKALGVDALETLGLSVRLGAEATELNGSLAYRENRGLVRVLAYGAAVGPRPDFVSARWPMVSAGRFSVAEAYAGVEEILRSASPGLETFVQGWIQGLNQQLGIDLKRDLIGSLGEVVVSAQAVDESVPAGEIPTAEQVNQLVAFSLLNRPAFENAVEALKGLGGPGLSQRMARREYLGETIHTFQPPADPAGIPKGKTVAYAVTPRWFLLGVGSAGPVESALQGLQGGLESLWDRTDVQQVLAPLPPNAATVTYQDLRLLMPVFLDGMLKGFERSRDAARARAAKGGAVAKPDFDWDARPDPKAIAKYWGHVVGAVSKESGAIEFATRIEHPR
ncbi:MAG: hypothetical protein A3G75_15010 [Verrucomicrobia bacterium RIFCSPLOWO2_12_FULL_64_8]|nr:MAG: hypothetical protein A3G75_15010 [Verrucomicrobia bacterium RIFCSPLOWO2_12_FULL_64_8]